MNGGKVQRGISTSFNRSFALQAVAMVVENSSISSAEHNIRLDLILIHTLNYPGGATMKAKESQEMIPMISKRGRRRAESREEGK